MGGGGDAWDAAVFALGEKDTSGGCLRVSDSQGCLTRRDGGQVESSHGGGSCTWVLSR